jgi:hypothetical protein
MVKKTNKTTLNSKQSELKLELPTKPLQTPEVPKSKDRFELKLEPEIKVALTSEPEPKSRSKSKSKPKIVAPPPDIKPKPRSVKPGLDFDPRPPGSIPEDKIYRKPISSLRRRLRKPTKPISPNNPNLFRALRISTRRLAQYSYTVLELFPKRHRERFGLGVDMISAVNRCLFLTIKIESFGARERRAELLRELSLQLKYLAELVEMAFGIYLIDNKRKETWLRGVIELDNVAIGLAMGIDRKSEKAGNNAG